ncbi:ISL3 family transposase [Actinoallomurus sp. NBC_01490]|uniref:ISL3 family transposase n=1 Tax=Actinoallomurus sp. NBC_01490 TaxID=2903557 RepID=UPI002E330DF5|nr:ISL3 family transposase [Actinoallomurus sp. NBC_01490]
MRIQARTRTSQAVCPSCGVLSGRVHSRYERRLSDQAIAGQETVIHLQVLRFLCRNEVCAKKTFAEQVPGLTVRYGRRSIGLGECLRAIALALGGRAGARLTHRLAAAVSRMTLIRMIRSLPDAAADSRPQVLGVDDFALRRGHRYGTVLIDMATSRPIDVLAERSAESLAAWLQDHPGIEVVCRDRAGRYAEGTTRGAPDAIQVADRWHMWRNLGEAVERTVTKHRHHLRELPQTTTQTDPAPPSDPQPDSDPKPREGRLAERTRQRHTAIHDLLAQGRQIRQIARELGLGRNTVRRFARATSPEELLVNNGTGQRPQALDEFADYLQRRWKEGCTNAEQLHRELRAQGYRGARTTVRQYVRPWRSNAVPLKPPPTPPTVRQVTGWILRHPDNLQPDERHQLETLTAASPAPASVREHVRGFAHMMLHLHGDQLERWMSAVESSDLPELRSFVTGLRRDLDAARAGLTLPYSSGKVEGHVNRIKMIKRQMYGRANPDLLRKRILLAD